MLKLKALLTAYFQTGLTDKKYDDSNRRIYVVNLFSFVGMVITGLMSFNAFIQQDYLLALVLFIASIIYFSGYLLQKKTHNTVLSTAFILYSLIFLMIYLVYSGGVNNTGPLWIFIIPPVALFMHGLKRGVIDNLVFIVVISFIMFYQNGALLDTEYSFQFKTRLIYSYLTVTFLSSFYEFSRNRTYQYTLELSKKYELLAKLDPLTKLSNRRDALLLLEQEHSKQKRNPMNISLILCDVDKFKLINDTYGHNFGDKVLIQLAECFQNALREQDIISRWGGEEFLFILPETSLRDANILAEKIHRLVRNLQCQHDKTTIHITVSMGISELTATQRIRDAINIADKCLYQAKVSGRNQTISTLAE
ncbi:GGDEF domain-containing protein [Litorilituus lipolyticus]|uniref:diguanylate cyclase n=1 Tax=Litorilituus lipolyticus TaxID=2491017 RepID=A0A502LEX7_9GAMM|nr:GGDEF domain-containing protein [Litorilituus lipolyticus]TPH18527.1 GGDEF domain-containing protein [Litorilituus lipolyticus]